jgi:hypothetical protein
MTPNLLSSFCRLTQNQQFPERQEVRARYVYSFISYILARLSHAHNLGAVWSTLKNIVFTFLNRQMPIPKTSGSRSFKIFIGGVAQGTTEDDLKNFFQTFGPVSNLLMTTYNSSWLHYSYKRWRWYTCQFCPWCIELCISFKRLRMCHWWKMWKLVVWGVSYILLLLVQ